MNYQSIMDLSDTIRKGLHLVPRGVDLIVGNPRSGILPASILALHLNVNVCDLNGLLTNAVIQRGHTRRTRCGTLSRAADASHVVILDDSTDSGESLGQVRDAVNRLALPAMTTYATVYATTQGQRHVDFFFRLMEQPRLFEWNVMHRQFLGECCVDIDGVLCVDPTAEENDDGPAYASFLRTAKPLALPSYKIGHLVSSRLEKYRHETEAWLALHQVEYGRLHLLDLPDAHTRRRLAIHGSFKGALFRRLSDTKLFIESEPLQAQQIAHLAGKPALCFSSQTMYTPGLSLAFAHQTGKSILKRLGRRLKRVTRNLLGGE